MKQCHICRLIVSAAKRSPGWYEQTFSEFRNFLDAEAKANRYAMLDKLLEADLPLKSRRLLELIKAIENRGIVVYGYGLTGMAELNVMTMYSAMIYAYECINEPEDIPF